MRPRRIVLLAAMLSLLSSAVSASTLITWEFSGVINGPSGYAPMDALYPVGTLLSLNITFDPASPSSRPPGPYGLYHAITSATLQLGNTTTTAPGGFISVNCYAVLGCPTGGSTNPFVEFLIFPSPLENPPLLPGARLTSMARIYTGYRDPNVAAGNIPTTPPDDPGGLEMLLGDPFSPVLILHGDLQSVREIDDVGVVPEPGSFLLLATGLAGLCACRRKKKIGQPAPLTEPSVPR